MKISSLILILAFSAPVLARADGSAREASTRLFREADALERKDKTSAEAWMLRGQAYGVLGKKKKALSAYGKALKRDPLLAEAYYRRGQIYEDLKKLDEAANEYQAALQADAGHSPAKEAWGRLSARPSGNEEK